MPTEVLAKGTTEANSTDITVAAGTPINVGLFRADEKEIEDHVQFPIYRKDPDGNYQPTGLTLYKYEPNVTLIGPGVYRVSRPVCTVATGIQTD